MELILLAFNFIILTPLYLIFRLASNVDRIFYLPDALVIATGSHFLGSMLIWYQSDSEAVRFITYVAFLTYLTVIAWSILVLVFARKPSADLSLFFLSRRGYPVSLFLVFLVNVATISALLLNPGLYDLIMSAFTFGEASLLDVRKAIAASTEGYVFPGLIKLSRDIISPIVIVSFILSRPKANWSIMFWIALFSTMVAMLIGGQRFPFVLILIALYVGFLTRQKIKNSSAKINLPRLFFLSVVLLIGFYLISNLLGRTNDNGSALVALMWSVASLFSRIFTTVPNEAVKTYAYWSTIGPTWGLSWISDLSILIPGPIGETLSSRLHQLGGGSAQGNAPLFFGLDAWFAFGWFGLPAVTMVFVLMFHFIDETLWKYRSPSNDAARIILYLHVPLIYSPYLFLLNGGIVVLPMVAWAHLMRSSFFKVGF